MFRKLFLGLSLAALVTLGFCDEDGNNQDKKFPRGHGMKKMGMLQDRDFHKKMEDEVKAWMESLPAEQKEEAARIVGYIHTTQQMIQSLRKEKQYDQAISILEKRSRLQTPQWFSTAPKPLQHHKIGALMEMGNIKVEQDKAVEGVKDLERALDEAKKISESPLIMKLTHDLTRAYKKAGMSDKAQSIMADGLKAMEANLQFE